LLVRPKEFGIYDPENPNHDPNDIQCNSVGNPIICKPEPNTLECTSRGLHLACDGAVQ